MTGKNNALIFENIYDDGQDFWFSEFYFNTLFLLKKGSWKLNFIMNFPDENFWQRRLYRSITLCNGKLYFAPYSAREIAEYDPKRNICRKLTVPMPNKDNQLLWKYSKFFGIFSTETMVFFIPAHYPGILSYDTTTGNFSLYDIWVDEIEQIRKSPWEYFITFIQSDNRLILPCACADAVVIFDIITKETRVIQTTPTKYECKFSGICYVDGWFYLVSADGTVTKRKFNKGKEEIIYFKLPESNSELVEFYPVCYLDGYIYLFPFDKNRGFKIDVKTDEVLTETLFDDEKDYNKREFSFLSAVSYRGKIYASTGNSHRFIEYDIKKKTKKELKLFLSKQEQEYLNNCKIREFIRRSLSEDFAENVVYSLEFMLNVLTDSKYKMIENKDKSLKSGRNIYNFL